MRRAPACSAVYDEEAALGEALRSAARAEELEFPSMIKARVWDALRHEKPSWIQLLRAGWAPRVAVPVAAVVILAGYLGLPPIIHGQQAAPASTHRTSSTSTTREAQQNPFGPGVAPAVYATDSQDRGTSSADSYIDAADAATLDDADRVASASLALAALVLALAAPGTFGPPRRRRRAPLRRPPSPVPTRGR